MWSVQVVMRDSRAWISGRLLSHTSELRRTSLSDVARKIGV